MKVVCTIQYYLLEAQYNYHVRLRPAHRSRAPRGPIAIIAFVAFVATASLLATAAITLSSDTVVVSAPLPPRGVDIIFGGVRRGVVIVVVILVRAPNLSRRRPASLSSSGWGKTTGPPRPPPTMSFPSSNVDVTRFVRADNENDRTVAPPQGLEFFEDVYDGNSYNGVGV